MSQDEEFEEVGIDGIFLVEQKENEVDKFYPTPVPKNSRKRTLAYVIVNGKGFTHANAAIYVNVPEKKMKALIYQLAKSEKKLIKASSKHGAKGVYVTAVVATEDRIFEYLNDKTTDLIPKEEVDVIKQPVGMILKKWSISRDIVIYINSNREGFTILGINEALKKSSSQIMVVHEKIDILKENENIEIEQIGQSRFKKRGLRAVWRTIGKCTQEDPSFSAICDILVGHYKQLLLDVQYSPKINHRCINDLLLDVDVEIQFSIAKVKVRMERLEELKLVSSVERTHSKQKVEYELVKGSKKEVERRIKTLESYSDANLEYYSSEEGELMEQGTLNDEVSIMKKEDSDEDKMDETEDEEISVGDQVDDKEGELMEQDTLKDQLLEDEVPIKKKEDSDEDKMDEREDGEINVSEEEEAVPSGDDDMMDESNDDAVINQPMEYNGEMDFVEDPYYHLDTMGDPKHDQFDDFFEITYNNLDL